LASEGTGRLEQDDPETVVKPRRSDIVDAIGNTVLAALYFVEQ
jgi:hypothetical protein